MKKIKIILLVTIVAIFATACSNQMKIEEVDAGQSFTYVKDGGFYLDNKGIAVPVAETEGKKVLEWYTEPICPYCLTLEEVTSPYLYDIQGDNTLIKYFPLTFLGGKGIEGEVTYSDVMSGLLLSMAENDPEMVGKYLHKVNNQEFLNQLQSASNQDEFIHQTYLDLEGTKWNEIQADLKTFMDITDRNTEFARRNKELASKTVDGRLTTPTLYIQGEEKALDLTDIKDPKGLLEEALK